MDTKQVIIITLRTLWNGIITILFYTRLASQYVWITAKAKYNLYYSKSEQKPQKKQEEKPKQKTYEEIYAKYINFYLNTPEEQANSQISPDLYSNEKRKLMFEDPNNNIEKEWKSRILIENTQQSGNIMMFYDCYRMEFVYYSDMQIVSNKALHYTAMKYVVINKCRDFFIDMENYPKNKIIDLLRAEDAKMKTKTISTNMEGRNDLVSTLSKTNTNKKPVLKQTQNVAKPTYPYSNKFMRVGKLADFNILQKKKNKNIERINKMMFEEKTSIKMPNFFDDNDDDDLEIKETDIEKVNLFEPLNEDSHQQQKKSDYAAFKRLQILKDAGLKPNA